MNITKSIITGSVALSAIANAKPNIVVINVDDLGWNDVNYLPNHKSPYYSPNIEKLSKQGMVFTNAYAACPVCSPTRASILTGKSPAALKITAHIPGKLNTGAKRVPKGAKVTAPDFHHQLPLEEVTFAELLKPQGYRTAFIGKYHLAGADVMNQKTAKGVIASEFHPDKQGFDINIGGCAYGQPKSYFDPYSNGTIKDRKKGEYLTDRLADEAVNFITENAQNKFLLYLNFYSVHTPIKAPKDRINFVKKKGISAKKATYAAMVYSVDLAIGKLVKTLKEKNLSENTLIIFTSDNGGLFDNKPLNNHKGSLYEGGIRVPFFAVWPGQIKEGTASDEPVISYDILPTLAGAAEVAAIPEKVEGENLLPIFTKSGQFKRKDPLFWYYPHYHHGGMESLDMGAAIRYGDWKYIKLYKNGKAFLFNLKDDLGEKNNLLEANPEKAAYLNQKLMEQIKQADANMPK